MHRNYFALYHAALELHEELAGGYLFEIHSQTRNEITLSFVAADGRHLQLIVTVRAREFSLSTREGLNRKRRNAATIMGDICEFQVISVSMAPRDREIIVELEQGCLLVIRFFSADTNLFLVRDGYIADAFKDRKTLEGTPWQPGTEETAFRALERLTADQTGFTACIEQKAQDNLMADDRKLAMALPGFDRALARELLARTRGNDTVAARFEAFNDMFFSLASPTPCVIDNTETGPEFSLFEPGEPRIAACFDTVLEALNHYTRKMHRFLHLHAGAQDLRRDLMVRIDRAERELAELDANDRNEAASRYETFGHLLTGAIGTTMPEGDRITIANMLDPGAPPVSIQLRPGLNIQQNAAWYFERAAKCREQIQATRDRMHLLEEQLRSCRLQLDRLELAESPEALQLLVGKRKGPGQKAPKANRPQAACQAKFRTVPLAPGVTLYVGKDARNNELLTFGYARPDDIWLHARGASGSHCILKGATMDRMGEIRLAAEIASWYSAARTAGLVPVMFTQKKFVRKAKGAPGSVIVERERVIMVKPRKG